MSIKPRILDLFCGAGGVAMGYHRAGFEVVGVDIKHQPHYPFEFHQADALTYPLDGFDAYHASPPCQRWSEATPTYARERHPNFIVPTRSRFLVTKSPFIIENVEGARRELVKPIMLCGTMFNLKVWRHRYFEIFGFDITSLAHTKHVGRPITINPGSNARKNQGKRNFYLEKEAMDIDWMSLSELSQAIPPAYTEYIGKQLMSYLVSAESADA